MLINGGGGSSFKKLTEGRSRGPIKTILMGNITVDTVLFQVIGDSSNSKESGGLGKPRGPVDPKREVVVKRKANPEMMKRITNFFLEIFISRICLSSLDTFRTVDWIEIERQFEFLSPKIVMDYELR